MVLTGVFEGATGESICMSLDAAAFLTPDGRWNLLQDWLDENPRNRVVFEMWLRQEPDEVFPQVRAVVAEIASKKFGPLAGALVTVTKMTPEIRSWIEEFQTLYNERKGDAHERERKNKAI